jgi:hypothetical protein
LGFAPREQGVRGRGASVIRQNPADFARNSFELCPIHTAVLNAVINCGEEESACALSMGDSKGGAIISFSIFLVSCFDANQQRARFHSREV